MPTRRIALLIAASMLGMPCVVGVTPTVAAEASATAFVTKIYDAYKHRSRDDGRARPRPDQE
jgi:hypothetical protein